MYVPNQRIPSNRHQGPHNYLTPHRPGNLTIPHAGSSPQRWGHHLSGRGGRHLSLNTSGYRSVHPTPAHSTPPHRPSMSVSVSVRSGQRPCHRGQRATPGDTRRHRATRRAGQRPVKTATVPAQPGSARLGETRCGALSPSPAVFASLCFQLSDL